MSLNAEGLKTLIQQKKQQRMNGIDVADPTKAAEIRDAGDLAIAEAIVQHIKENLTVKLPSGEVVIAVVGQATGTKNTTIYLCVIGMASPL